MSLASHRQWILWPGHPKHSQNHPGLAEGQPEGPLVQGNLASQLNLTQKRSLGLIRAVDLWPGHPKHSQNRRGLPEGPLVQGNLASQLKRL